MQRPLHFAPVGGVAAARLGVVGAAQLNHAAGAVFDHFLAADKVAVAQAHFLARGEAEIFGRRDLAKILFLDVQRAREGHLARASGGIFGVVDRIQLLHLPLRVVGQHHLERVEHAHDAQGSLVEVLAHAVLEERDIDDVRAFAHAGPVDKIADRLGGVTAPAQPAEGGHARVVPAAHGFFLDQLLEKALAEDGIGQFQAGKLDLPRLENPQLVEKPFVQRAVDLVVDVAQRVRHALDRVRLPVGVVVHRVDAPPVARAVVAGVEDAVHHRIAQVDVGRGHIDLGPQRARAFGELAPAHALEQVQVFLHRAAAVRALFTRFGQRPAVLAHLVRAQVADIGLALFNQLDRPQVELLEVIRGVVLAVLPVVAQPMDILFDRIDVFGVFLDRVGVVVAQVALAAKGFRQAEIDADRLGMADVQIAVGFGGKRVWTRS